MTAASAWAASGTSPSSSSGAVPAIVQPRLHVGLASVSANASLLALTIPAISTYDIATRESVVLTIPSSALRSKQRPAEEVSFVIEAVKGMATLSGAVLAGPELVGFGPAAEETSISDLSAERLSFRVTLVNDTWSPYVGAGDVCLGNDGSSTPLSFSATSLGGEWTPIDDTPAQHAGIESGDLIIRLDAKPVKGMSLNDAVKLMRGKPGSEIILTIVREGVEKPFKVSIIRDVVKVRSVRSRMLEEGFGYVRVSHFQVRSPQGLLKEVEQLEEKNEGPLRGLVLDCVTTPAACFPPR